MAEAKYAYLLSDYGLFRISIPDLDLDLDDNQFKLEWVCSNEAHDHDDHRLLPDFSTMGMFSHGHNVYLVGGTDYYPPTPRTKMYICNPSSQTEFPMTALPQYKPTDDCEPTGMVFPIVFRAKDRIYFFSFYKYYVLNFQSFDPINNSFLPLPSPPISFPNEIHVIAHFFVLDYIYLFIRELNGRLEAFSFNTNTKSSPEWEKMQWLCEEFENLNIPIPLHHNGDTGVSNDEFPLYHNGDTGVSDEEFPHNTRILVALVFGMPTAYHVCLDKAGGSLKPKSYRRLLDYRSSLVNMSDLISIEDEKFGLDYVKSYLLDIGDERFCVIHSSPEIPLLVYVFQMDFYVEYENQLGKSAALPSIQILSSKNFHHQSTPNFEIFSRFSVCLASAPALSKRCFVCGEFNKVEDNNDPVNNQPVKDDVPGVVYLEV